MKNKNILVIGGMPLLHKMLYDCGVSVSLLIAGGYPLRPDPSIYRNIFDIAVNDKAQTLRVLKKIHTNHPFTDILCLHDCAVEIGAKVAASLQLPFFDEETVRRSIYKNVMRDCLHNAGLDKTPFKVVSNLESIESFGLQHGYPLVIKPINGRASQGVQIINNINEAPQNFSDSYLVEKKLLGIEVSVESYSKDGLFQISSLTEKFTSGVIECGHVMPPISLTEQQIKLAICFAQNSLQALGQDKGLGHTEMFIDGTNMAIVETHLRGGGDRILDLMKLKTGYNLPSLLISDMLSKSYQPTLATYPAAAVWFLLPKESGVLKSIENVEETREMPGVYDISLLKTPGDKIGAINSSYDRLALVIAYGDNSEEALRRAQQACLNLSVSIHR